MLSTTDRVESRDEYQRVTFTTTVEAAAFVAALSRYLNSPLYGAHTQYSDAEAVLARAAATPGSVELFLSDAAIGAARAAFPPVPVDGTVARHALPADCAPVIGMEPPPAWGLNDAEERLKSLLAPAGKAD